MTEYLVSVGTVASIWVVLALSLNLVTGFAGQVSLAQGALFGSGAYAAAILSTRHGIAFPLDLVLAAVVTALVAAIVALPAIRIRHDFLVLTTMGVNFVLVAVFQYSDYFGGSSGIVGVPLFKLGDALLSPVEILLLALGLACFTLATQWLLLRTWFGLRLVAIRDDEAAAAATGISVSATKIWAFALAGAYAGLAGAFYAHFIGSVFPSSFGFVESVTILSMVVLGGEGTLIGPTVAAIVLRSLPEVLRPVEDWRLVIYGLALALVIRFQPAGLLGHGSFLRRACGRVLRTPAAWQDTGVPVFETTAGAREGGVGRGD